MAEKGFEFEVGVGGEAVKGVAVVPGQGFFAVEAVREQGVFAQFAAGGKAQADKPRALAEEGGATGLQGLKGGVQQIAHELLFSRISSNSRNCPSVD